MTDEQDGAGMYRIHCEKCGMITGKMSSKLAKKAAGAHTVGTGHCVYAKKVSNNE